MTGRNLAAALLTGVAVFASPMSANACGTVKIFASVYLVAEKSIADPDVRARCQMQMLGSLLCVSKSYLSQPDAKRLLRAALAHAENSGKPRLKCAGEHVARYFSVTPAAKPDTGKPPLEELLKPEAHFISFCEPDKLRSDEEAIGGLPGPGQRLRECLSR